MTTWCATSSYLPSLRRTDHGAFCRARKQPGRSGGPSGTGAADDAASTRRGERLQAEAAAQALFSGDISALSSATLREALASAPTSQHARGSLAGRACRWWMFWSRLDSAKSKREAREFTGTGAVLVNGKKAGSEDRLRTDDLLHGEFIALRRGKKNWHPCASQTDRWLWFGGGQITTATAERRGRWLRCDS